MTHRSNTDRFYDDLKIIVMTIVWKLIKSSNALHHHLSRIGNKDTQNASVLADKYTHHDTGVLDHMLICGCVQFPNNLIITYVAQPHRHITEHTAAEKDRKSVAHHIHYYT